MYFKKSYRHCREKITSIHKTMYVEKRLDHCRGSSPRPYSNNPPDKIEVINDQEGLRSIKEITLRQRTGNLKKIEKTPLKKLKLQKMFLMFLKNSNYKKCF